MDYTSERVIPEEYSHNLEEYLIYLLHLKTYHYILPWVTGKRVLDLGCGEGFGPDSIASQASHVTAVDISKETIEKARQKYRANNLSFQVIDLIENKPLPFADKSFDTILSFQVIEHIKDVPQYLKEITRLLNPKGQFILSTPNASTRLLPGQNPWNKHHLREFTAGQLLEDLKSSFGQVELAGITFDQPWKDTETKRTRRNKWILYPFTNKLVPHSTRQYFLQKIWEMAVRRKNNKSLEECDPGKRPQRDSVLITKNNIPSCASLLAVCHI